MIKKVPAGWSIEKVKNFGKFIRGVSYGKDDLHPQSNEDTITLLRANNIQAKLDLSDVQYVNNLVVKEQQYLKKNDILFAMSSGSKHLVGKNILIDTDITKYSFGAFCSVFRTNSTNILPRYLFFVFHSTFYKQAIAITLNGTNINNLRASDLEKLSIPIPLLPQQEKIVTVLDTASQLVEKQKALIEKYDLFLKSKFIEMFGDPVLNPMGWEIAPLKKFGKVITGNTPSRKVDEYYNDDYIEWIKTDNISSDELYVSEASEYLSEEGMEKSRVLQKGALLTTCIAGSLKSIGNACLTDRTVCFNQQINAIQPNEDCHPLFLYAMFGVVKNYIQTFATSSMKKIITKGEFEKIEFINPPFELQGKYAAILEKVYVMKAQEQKKLEKLQTLYDALMQQAFNGEIV